MMTAIRLLGMACLLALPLAATAANPQPAAGQSTYSDDEVMKAASKFFSTGAKDLGDVLADGLLQAAYIIADQRRIADIIIA